MKYSKPPQPGKFFDETLKNYPWVFELGPGTYSGIQGGYVIRINRKEYKSPCGYRGINIPVRFNILDQDTIEYL